MKRNKKLKKTLRNHFTIKRLINKNNALIDSLIEKRNKINLLASNLEQRIKELEKLISSHNSVCTLKDKEAERELKVINTFLDALHKI